MIDHPPAAGGPFRLPPATRAAWALAFAQALHHRTRPWESWGSVSEVERRERQQVAAEVLDDVLPLIVAAAPAIAQATTETPWRRLFRATQQNACLRSDLRMLRAMLEGLGPYNVIDPPTARRAIARLSTEGRNA